MKNIKSQKYKNKFQKGAASYAKYEGSVNFSLNIIRQYDANREYSDAADFLAELFTDIERKTDYRINFNSIQKLDRIGQII